MMLTQQDKEDFAFARQKVSEGDDHFVPVVRYFENDCCQKKKWLERLQKLVINILQNNSAKQIYEAYNRNIGYSTITKVARRQHGCISESSAEKHFYSLRKLYPNCRINAN